MKKSQFMKWFEAQFGERPSKEEIYDLSNKVNELRKQLRLAEFTLEKTQEWDSMLRAAKFSNVASKDDFKF